MKVDYVDDWFLMRSPLQLFFITSLYLLFVLKVGPAYMKNRSAFKLTNVLALYNAFQVIFSVCMSSYGTYILWENGLFGRSCLLETKEGRYMVTSSMYVYLSAKFTELADTIFFVLRKKYNQVTFLHVYHHTLILCGTWLTLKYEPSYSVMFMGIVNSYVHIIMYVYYGLSAFPNMVKYLWWKMHITRMQLVQFFIILVHSLANMKYSGCSLSNTLMISIVVNVSLLMYLFSDFYATSYMKSKGQKMECKINKNGTINRA